MQNKNTLAHLGLSTEQKILAQRASPPCNACERRRKADKPRAVGIQKKLAKKEFEIVARWHREMASLQERKPEAGQFCYYKRPLAGERQPDVSCCNMPKDAVRCFNFTFKCRSRSAPHTHPKYGSCKLTTAEITRRIALRVRQKFGQAWYTFTYPIRA